ncbi:MAG: hypothetical protein SGARI_003938, partial [Bacillariaceae sp.]
MTAKHKDGNSKNSNSKTVCNTYAPDPYASSTYGVRTPGPEFGWSVAINCDGSQVLVGSANDPAAVYLYNGSKEKAAFPEELLLRTFHNPHGAHAEHNGLQSQFGLAVQMNANGERILIGDPALETVYLYDSRGHLLHTFKNPNFEKSGDFESMFGYSMAVSDDGAVIAIGAPESYFHEYGATGAVYLFHQLSEEDPTKWIGSEPIYKPGNRSRNDNFGDSIALSPDGTLLLAGAWQANDGVGDVHLFLISQEKRENGGCVPTVELKRTIISPEEEETSLSGFGWAVDLTDEYAFVGAKGAHSQHKKGAGEVYVYKMQDVKDENEFDIDLIDTILHTASEDDECGGALSAAGNRLLVASY